MNLEELFRSLVGQAGVKTVYGDPVTSEGRTVIPVARVRCGFGGGSGKKATEQEGGGGFVAKPAGFIEISAQGTRFVPITDSRDFALAVGFGVCLGLLVGRVIGSKE